MANNLELVVNGEKIPINDFVQNILNDVLLAILQNLRRIDLDSISKIEVT